MGHSHAMATAKVMRTSAVTGCDSPHGGVHVRTRPYSAEPSWLEDRVAVLQRLLAELHSLRVPAEAARAQITGHLELLMTVLEFDRQAARHAVTDDVLHELALDIAATAGTD